MARRSIFVTGAGSGIGEATTRLFAERGWLVGAADVSRDGLGRVEREGSVVTYHADVRDRESMERAIADFAEQQGRLDAVFASAGLLFMGNHEDISATDKQLMIDVNNKGVLNTIDPAFPYLRDTENARIVAMASASAEYGTPQHAVYSATKAWVRALTEALDIEYARYGIRVAAIYVAYVNTAMIHEATHQARSVAKMGVNVEPEEVAEAVWKAVHGTRTHWRVGIESRAIHWLVRLFGSLTPFLIRKRLGF